MKNSSVTGFQPVTRCFSILLVGARQRNNRNRFVRLPDFEVASARKRRCGDQAARRMSFLTESECESKP